MLHILGTDLTVRLVASKSRFIPILLRKSSKPLSFFLLAIVTIHSYVYYRVRWGCPVESLFWYNNQIVMLNAKSACSMCCSYATWYMFIGGLFKFYITHKQSKKLRWNSYWSNSLAKSQKAVEACVFKPYVADLSIVPHALGALTANSTCTCCIASLEDFNESKWLHVCSIHV